jgi:arginase
MPLAASLGFDNLESRKNSPSQKALAAWEKIKNTGIEGPKILPQDLVFIGLRDTEPEEDFLLNKHKIKSFSVEQLREKGVVNVCLETAHILKDCDLVYVSFDVDSMDSELVSKGTGTPVPNGLTELQALEVIRTLLNSDKVCSFEIVEINPTLDNKGNSMAETALRVLETACQVIENRPSPSITKTPSTERYSHFSNVGRLSVVKSI